MLQADKTINVILALSDLKREETKMLRRREKERQNFGRFGSAVMKKEEKLENENENLFGEVEIEGEKEMLKLIN